MYRQIPVICFFILSMLTISVHAQKSTVDSVVRRIVYRDTIVYRYDTVRIVRYIQTDTIVGAGTQRTSYGVTPKKRGVINPNNWGIGPSIGAYYSPFHGADINIGFGVQYYFLSVPSFRNPHLGHRKRK